MKRLLGLLIITGLLGVSCSQQDDPSCSNGILDGTETSVDCGGNCPPCPVPNPNSNPNPPNITLQDLQGLWEFNAERRVYSPGVGGAGFSYLDIKLSSNCKMDLATTIATPFPSYDVYGIPTTCGYPTASSYYYNSGNNTLNCGGSWIVHSATNDSLQFSQLDLVYYYYSKTAMNTINPASVDWEINLAASYPINNQFAFVLKHNNIYDTVHVVSGQTSYSGNQVVNLAAGLPSFEIFLKGYLPPLSNNILSFNTKVSITGSDIICETGPHYYCPWGESVCNGYDWPNSGQYLNKVTWTQ